MIRVLDGGLLRLSRRRLFVSRLFRGLGARCGQWDLRAAFEVGMA
jgi:hypothetical protein